MCLSLEHQSPSKTSEKMGYFDRVERLQFRYTFYRPQAKRLRARKIGLQYKILIKYLKYLLLGTSCLGRPSGDVPCASEGVRTKHGPGVHGPPLWTGYMDHFHGPGPWTPCHGPGPCTVFFIFIRRFCTRSMDTHKQK